MSEEQGRICDKKPKTDDALKKKKKTKNTKKYNSFRYSATNPGEQ